MKPMANSLVPNKYFWFAIIWTTIIAVLCLESAQSLPNIGFKIKGLDKIVHGTFHLIFTILWFLYFKSKKSSFQKSILTAFAMSVFYGIIIEICQQVFTTTRQADILDFLANTTGALLAVLIVYKLKPTMFGRLND